MIVVTPGRGRRACRARDRTWEAMPIYEYVCAKCRKTIEVIQRHADAPPAEHAGCGGAMNRLVSTPSVRIGDNDGLTGSTHSSILRADDNFKSARGKKR
jgi:putative FmdB family regulatory protein